MKKMGLILVLLAFCFADIAPIRGKDSDNIVKVPVATTYGRGTLIDSVGDIRATMGSSGKNICVSADGNAIAVCYGYPTGDPNATMKIKVAYSTDGGASWALYGPFSGDMRRIYPAVDGTDDFDAQPGELIFGWQESPNGYNEGAFMIMIEENLPSSPSPSVPTAIPGTSGADFCPWNVSVAVSPDIAYHVVGTAQSYLNNGNNNTYAWVSTDGGYSWSDSVNIGDGEVTDVGHTQMGTGGYVFHNMHKDSIIATLPIALPWYNESTDGGFTWLGPERLPLPFVPDTITSFWWHEFDCMVIDNEPWSLHTNTGSAQDSMWLWHGTGSPGAWTWDVMDVRAPMYSDFMIGDTVCQSVAVYGAGYPQLAYDPVNDIILAAMTTNYFKATPTDTVYDGWYIGGLYSNDGGSTWNISKPLCDVAFASANLGHTEVAHEIADGHTYATFIDEVELQLYFFGAQIEPFVGIDEASGRYVSAYRFGVTPTVTSNNCRATFTMPAAGNISLAVYDVSGRVVDRVYSGYASGEQQFNINTSNLANGTYFVVLETEQVNITQKLITLR